jgi:lipid-A-disaccharide synthase
VPQVWAWKPGRIKTIEENVDLLISILPFEKELFNSGKIKCEFVGHPLLDLISAAETAGDTFGAPAFDDSGQLVALLPGSRVVEITRHYPIMLESVKLIQRSHPAVKPLTLIRPEIDPAVYCYAHRQTGVEPHLRANHHYRILKGAACSFVTSGTATLEAALCGRPFCVVYKTGLLTYLIARSVIKLKMIGMVNIVAGKIIVPEFLQTTLTPESLAAFCREMLDNDDARRRMISALATVRSKLGEPGAIARAASLIYQECLQ